MPFKSKSLKQGKPTRIPNETFCLIFQWNRVDIDLTHKISTENQQVTLGPCVIYTRAIYNSSCQVKFFIPSWRGCISFILMKEIRHFVKQRQYTDRKLEEKWTDSANAVVTLDVVTTVRKSKNCFFKRNYTHISKNSAVWKNPDYYELSILHNHEHDGVLRIFLTKFLMNFDYSSYLFSLCVLKQSSKRTEYFN